MRTARIERKTRETAVSLTLNLDGTGVYEVECPVGFLGHMLDSFCTHGLFDLSGTLSGDLAVDQHHLVEDTGITLGEAFSRALGDRAGINRVGSCLYPMDETLARAAVDFSGRPYLFCAADLTGALMGTFQTDTFSDFWQGFSYGAKAAIHLDILRGRSDHHKMEALFKAAGRALRIAVALDPRRGTEIPSTKGIIS